MYAPPAFREDRPEVLQALMRAYPLATLVTAHEGALCANLAPILLEADAGGDVLRTHLARGNDQLAALAAGAEALVIFQGPQAYVSPGWYATKAEHGRVVPTWNYIVVQAWGPPRVIDDPAWLRGQVSRLTERHEQGRAAPWSITDAPDDYIAAQLRGIVGVEIPVARIEGKWKVSQNHPEANRRGVAAGLEADGRSEMAQAVAAAGRG